MSQLLTRVGPVQGADGTSPAFRSGRESDLIVSQAHGRFAEAVRRGNVYSTAPTAVPLLTNYGTTSPFVLYNPPGSGKWLSILRVSVGYGSGTLGAGSLMHAASTSPTQAAPSGGTPLTPNNNLIGQAGNSVAVPRVSGTVATPVGLGVICSLDAELASSVDGLRTCVYDVDGEFIIKEGCAYHVAAVAAAGTSPVICLGVSWEEITNN